MIYFKILSTLWEHIQYKLSTLFSPQRGCRLPPLLVFLVGVRIQSSLYFDGFITHLFHLETFCTSHETLLVNLFLRKNIILDQTAFLDRHGQCPHMALWDQITTLHVDHIHIHFYDTTNLYLKLSEALILMFCKVNCFTQMLNTKFALNLIYITES